MYNVESVTLSNNKIIISGSSEIIKENIMVISTDKLCFTTFVSSSQSRFGNQMFISSPPYAITAVNKSGSVAIIIKLVNGNDSESVQIIADINIAGDIMLICKSAFALIKWISSIGDDFIIQRLWLSSDIEQLDITVDAVITQNNKVKIAVNMVLFSILIPNIDSIPLIPKLASSIENTSINAGPLIVFVMYAGVER